MRLYYAKGAPSAADAAFVNLSEADWRVLTYVRVFVFQLTVMIFSQTPIFLAVAVAWPASFEGHWVMMALIFVGHAVRGDWLRTNRIELNAQKKLTHDA